MIDLKLTHPEGFLLEEERCGFKVTAEMKKVWAVELDLFNTFKQVCAKYGLTYYADGGTILGAIRHKGFVPWDNDIDVAMPRPDYDKLLALGNDVFEHPYFLQTPATEEGRYFTTWAKLCNSDTTGRGLDEFSKGINCGIFIDIFPFDKIPEGTIAKKLYFARIDNVIKSARFCFATQAPKGLKKRLSFRIRKAIYTKYLHSPNAGQLFDLFNKAAASSWDSNSSLFGGVIFGYIPKYCWQYKDWAECTDMKFEYIDIQVPNGYDAILSQQYGNYMSFPTDKSTHEYHTFDAETPYKEYFSK